MKKYISSATFPERGSARQSDVRNGVLPFGKLSKSEFPLGYSIVHLATANTTCDVNTLRLETYCNIRINLADVPYTDADGYFYQCEFKGYTVDEVNDLLRTIKSMSYEELKKMLQRKHM